MPEAIIDGGAALKITASATSIGDTVIGGGAALKITSTEMPRTVAKIKVDASAQGSSFLTKRILIVFLFN